MYSVGAGRRIVRRMDEYELVDYLNDKLTILKAMRTFVFCTIRN